MRDDDLLDALTREDPFDPDREIPRQWREAYEEMETA